MDLSEACMSQATVRSYSLTQALLFKANLHSISITNVMLDRSTFDLATLDVGYFFNCSLTQASFIEIDLGYSNWNECSFHLAN